MNLEVLVVRQFLLERLHHRILLRHVLATHVRDQPSFLVLPLMCTVGVLRALVAMVDCTLRWPPAVQGYCQCSAGQRLVGRSPIVLPTICRLCMYSTAARPAHPVRHEDDVRHPRPIWHRTDERSC